MALAHSKKRQTDPNLALLLERWSASTGWTKRNILRAILTAYGILLTATWIGVLAKDNVRPSFTYAAVVMSIGFWGACEGRGQIYENDQRRAINSIKDAIG